MQIFSLLFVGFALLVVAAYGAAPARARVYVLAVASIAFYAAVDGHLPYVLAVPAVLDYIVTRRIAAATERSIKRRWLVLGIAVDLAVLSLFKYFHAAVGVWFPLGISYFMFKSMSAIVDVYRGKPPPARWVDYVAYLSFFPQLVAGPIQRFTSFSADLGARRAATLDDVRRGSALILRGVFKKLVVANNLAYVSATFFGPGNGSIRGSLDALFATYAYVWEMYADFSGYSDVANGIAAFFGFAPVVNFNLPFFSTRVSEYWRRWHISLSSWVNDYVLFGLVGLRARGLKLYAGVLASMIAIGVWHGPVVAFAVFGAYHGMLLVGEMWLRTAGWIAAKPARRWTALASAIIVFHLVALGELLFATRSVTRTAEVIASIFTGQLWTDRTTVVIAMVATFVMPLFALDLFERFHPGIAALSPIRRGLVYSAIVAAIVLFGTSGGEVMYAAF